MIIVSKIKATGPISWKFHKLTVWTKCRTSLFILLFKMNGNYCFYHLKIVKDMVLIRLDNITGLCACRLLRWQLLQVLNFLFSTFADKFYLTRVYKLFLAMKMGQVPDFFSISIALISSSLGTFFMWCLVLISEFFCTPTRYLFKGSTLNQYCNFLLNIYIVTKCWQEVEYFENRVFYLSFGSGI